MNFEWALKQLKEGYKVKTNKTPSIWLDREDGKVYRETEMGISECANISIEEILSDSWKLGYDIFFERIEDCIDFDLIINGTRIKNAIQNYNKNIKEDKRKTVDDMLIFIGDIVQAKECEMQRIPQLGNLSIDSLKCELKKMNLFFNMKLSKEQEEMLHRLKERSI